MKIELLKLAFAAVAALGPGAATGGAAAAQDTEVFLGEDGELRYVGLLTEAANERLFALYDAAEPKPRMLVINSGGGDTDDGMALGAWMRDNQLDLTVEEFCASSCANYVFTAARTRYLHRDSTLLWHGGLRSFDDSDLEAEVENPVFRVFAARALRQKQDQEVAFFQTIGVDPDIVVYGTNTDPEAIAAIESEVGKSVVGFDYSLEDLARMGVGDIELIDGEWEWRAHSASERWNNGYVFRMELPEDYAR